MVTPGDIVRHEMFVQTKRRLEELAWRGLKLSKLKPTKFFVICIDVDDPAWTFLAETLMPNNDWQVYRDRGEKPIARGTVFFDNVGKYLANVCPGIAPALVARDATEQAILAVVLASGGASVYKVAPRAEPS